MGMWTVSLFSTPCLFLFFFFFCSKLFADISLLYRPSGVRFTASAGSSEFVKRWTPQAGDIVSFKHHGFLHTSQKPKLPSIHRLRNDLSWADVVLNWRQQTVAPQGISLFTSTCNNANYIPSASPCKEEEVATYLGLKNKDISVVTQMHREKKEKDSLEKSGFIEDERKRETQSQQRKAEENQASERAKANERNQRREG